MRLVAIHDELSSILQYLQSESAIQFHRAVARESALVPNCGQSMICSDILWCKVHLALRKERGMPRKCALAARGTAEAVRFARRSLGASRAIQPGSSDKLAPEVIVAALIERGLPRDHLHYHEARFQRSLGERSWPFPAPHRKIFLKGIEESFATVVRKTFRQLPFVIFATTLLP